MPTTPPLPAHVRPDQVFEFDIYADPRITDDVQGSYATVLCQAPDIFWTRANGGHWIVQRTDLITDIVKHPELFSAREMQILRVPNPPYMIPLSVDPPHNVPYRQAIMPKFSSRSIAALEPRMRHWAQQIVAEVADTGACDFIRDVSSRFPVSVFMEVMGLPLDKLRAFRTLADAYFNARTGEDIARLSGDIFAIFNELIALRTAQPADDLISHFLTVKIDGRPITHDEILAMCFVLFLGGMDTVTNVTGFTFQYLAHDPVLQERLAADPALIPKFVEEGLRLFGVINTPRLVVQDCERVVDDRS
jgi:cytochrome P450